MYEPLAKVNVFDFGPRRMTWCNFFVVIVLQVCQLIGPK
jgi:hypothetical protein